jgi:hypothetical protein
MVPKVTGMGIYGGYQKVVESLGRIQNIGKVPKYFRGLQKDPWPATPCWLEGQGVFPHGKF